MKKLILLSALLISAYSFGQISQKNPKSESNGVEVSSDIVETYPVYPGCKKKASNSKNRKCLVSSISEFVMRKFDTDIANDLGLSGRQRISVIFKIDKKGYVKDIRIRAPHPRLEKEAFRVINMLPKMKPGTQNGQPVIVPYSLPIVFQVAPSTTTKP